MDQPMKDYEKKHIELLRNSASECTLFLKTNGAFPLEKPCKVLLAGNGGRETMKGGFGSGEVESRYFTTCEQGLESQGFEIVSKKWLDEYPKFKEAKLKEHVELIKEIAVKYKSTSSYMSVGSPQPDDAEYDLPLDYEADCAIYVITRMSGENGDRHLVKGDVYLTDSEKRDILLLNKKFNKFMLVLNVVGIIDLSPVNEVSNILLLSQLGVVTGDILADVVLGKANPSGKLATTWTDIKDYKFLNEFGDLHRTRYKEGVYVGYRYFDSAKVEPLYPFGYGKSYTDFELSKSAFSANKNEITIKVKVKNIGKYPGKEVVQIYISPPQTNKDKPYQSLVAFKKSKELKPQEEEELTIVFNLETIARYDEEKASYILDNGNYIIRVGNSSKKTSIYGCINLSEDVITEKLMNIGGKPDFEDYKPDIKITDDLSNVETIKLTKNDFVTKTPEYDYKPEINEKLDKLTDEDLCHLCCGFYQTEGKKKFQHVVGEAGETTLFVKEIDKYLVMCDGPAGIRITRIYGEDEKGLYRLSFDPIGDRMKPYMTDEEWKNQDTYEHNKDRKGKLTYQYTTALPIGTALAQSFNVELVQMCGDIVGEEMDIFKIHLWLAPGMNIHRNLLCGRNFEYYSEDPLVAGKMAAAITQGVQKHKNRGTTIKHFCCNNQELNRMNNDSILSERAMREIYMKGFEIAIKEAKPEALMTSYNLVNGFHSSERKDLINDVIRNEWKFRGLVMSDWFDSGVNFIEAAILPAQSATNNLKAGNNIQMSCERIFNYNDLVNSVKNKNLDRNTLLENASMVYKTIEKLNQ